MAYTSKDANTQFHLSPEQEAHVLELTRAEDITAYMHECAVDNGAFQQAEGLAPGKLVAVPQSESAQVSAKLPDGTMFTGTSEEVAAAVGAQLARNAEAARQQQNDPARDSRTGRFTADQGRNDESEALRVAAAAELELRFKRGEIPAAEYLAQSGVIDQYLEAKGIDVNAHQAQQQEGQKVQQSWATATEQFKARHADWPGGENLMYAMVERLDKLGLTDTPSVESLERAYTALDIEASMAKETDPYKMEELKERWRQEVEGRRGNVPQYNQ